MRYSPPHCAVLSGLLLVIFGSSCTQPEVVAPEPAEIEEIEQWVPAAALQYIDAQAFKTYEQRGKELLNVVYDGPVELIVNGVGSSVRLAPKNLTIERKKGSSEWLLFATFSSNMLVDTQSSCGEYWSPGDVQVTADIRPTVDTIGVLSPNIESLTVDIVPTSDYTDPPCANDANTTLSEFYEAAVHAYFNDPSPLRRLSHAMMGGDSGYSIQLSQTVRMISIPGDGHSVLDGKIVRQNRVALLTTPGQCQGLTRDKSSPAPTTPITAPPIPLDNAPFDWAVAWRVDMLQHVLTQLSIGGYFCRADGLERLPQEAPALSLRASELDVRLPPSVRPDDQVAWSIIALEPPNLDIDKDGAIDLYFPRVNLQLFVMRWDIPHLVDRRETSVTLNGAEIVLKDRVVQIRGGQWKDADESYWGTLFDTISARLNLTIPVGSVAATFPFLSRVVSVTRTQDHLVAAFEFRDDAPPSEDLYLEKHAALATEMTTTPTGAPMSCGRQPRPPSQSMAWMLISMVALTVLRRRL